MVPRIKITEPIEPIRPFEDEVPRDLGQVGILVMIGTALATGFAVYEIVDHLQKAFGS